MACPTCGGDQRRTIAPGYFECLSERFVPVNEPRIDGLISPTDRVTVCGTRYQEGVGQSVDKCFCRTNAIGECFRCGVAVCGDHSDLLEGRRLCKSCRRLRHDELLREEQDALDKKIAQLVCRMRDNPDLETLESCERFEIRMPPEVRRDLFVLGSRAFPTHDLVRVKAARPLRRPRSGGRQVRVTELSRMPVRMYAGSSNYVYLPNGITLESVNHIEDCAATIHALVEGGKPVYLEWQRQTRWATTAGGDGRNIATGTYGAYSFGGWVRRRWMTGNVMQATDVLAGCGV